MVMYDAARKLSALIAEDSEQFGYLLEYMLRRDGFDVTRATDGRETAAIISQGPATDIVILDIMLPYLDGFELIALLRAHPLWQQVPIIVVSGRSREGDVVRALQAGADDYVCKPYQPAELLARIKTRVAAARERNVA